MNLLAFVTTTWLLAMLPGVGQAIMLRQVLVRGRRAALMSNLGTAVGLLIWSFGAAAGLSAILLANPAAFATLRIAGGVVLVWLGVRGLLALRHPVATLDHTAAQVDSPRADFVTGLAVNLGNPKAGVFAIALLPQFVPAQAPQFWAMTGLGVLWAVVTMTWYVLFIRLAERGRVLLSRRRPATILTGVSSLSLVGIGVTVAAGL